MNEQNKIGRRKAIVGIGAAIALATLKPVTVTAEKNENSQWPGGLQDPLNKYPKPPFQAQQQEWPGLAGKMVPRPDHGEKSYVGSGRLRGRKALITGGDS